MVAKKKTNKKPCPEVLKRSGAHATPENYPMRPDKEEIGSFYSRIWTMTHNAIPDEPTEG